MTEYIRTTENGDTYYYDGAGWLSERDTCHHCMEERMVEGKPFRFAEVHNS